MPRTVEHILSCHHAARARVARGMKPWAFTIFMRDVLEADPREGVEKGSPEHAADVAADIAKRIKKFVPADWRKFGSEHYDMALEEVIEHMEQMTANEFRADVKATGEEPLDLLDEHLEDLYDWADRHRVWIG